MLGALFNSNAGVTADKGDFYGIARVAFNKGEVGMLDLANADGDVNNNDPGKLDSGFSNVVAPTSGANTTAAVHVVALEDIAQDARGKFAYCGIVMALVGAASGDVAANEPLWVNQANKVLTKTPAQGIHVKAHALVARTAPGAGGVLTPVLFSGHFPLALGPDPG